MLEYEFRIGLREWCKYVNIPYIQWEINQKRVQSIEEDFQIFLDELASGTAVIYMKTERWSFPPIKKPIILGDSIYYDMVFPSWLGTQCTYHGHGIDPNCFSPQELYEALKNLEYPWACDGPIPRKPDGRYDGYPPLPEGCID